ncbi:type IV toxin-antitoxin system AbiEi family antitoxin domain-containing protein [Nocardioides marinus]|uniref:AbiEi antitoxin N-terminal domain-containing protein n=1 Tax=Nocardioides marinus TaxID=374514 RepID=A0A7Y9YGX6_9ACTN|nr:type IV toxin-antitoxin system AbiEi family antitoxin domain-containing protein [Nocardioides marinus]NYI10847.1 hypothetical protein [Nocardioides marinus]
MDAIDRLLRRQAGVVSRRQVLAAGMSEVLVARRVRRREWVRVGDGVYVDHTGRLSTAQEEWAALLLHPGSVLAGRSALRAGGSRAGWSCGGDGWDRERRVVEIAVPHGRRLDAVPGVRAVQLRGLDAAALPRASPPRLRVEHAALMVASRARGDDEAVAVLADVVREGLTVPARLEDVLVEQRRLPRRRLLLDVVRDVESGAESPLERRYLRDVERRHALPRGVRQAWDAVAGRAVFRDVRYSAYRTNIELDGRLGHSRALDRWADLERDLEAAARGDVTLRIGWQQVLEPCRLAVTVGGVLALRGWTGPPTACGAACGMRPEGVS